MNRSRNSDDWEPVEQTVWRLAETTKDTRLDSTCINKVGELRERRDEVLSVEWKINSFLTLSGSAGSEYKSDDFTFLGSSWNLQLYPHGISQSESSEWISLYLKRENLTSSQTVTFELGIKKADGNVCLQQTSIRKFEGCARYGFPNFVRRSDVQQRKDELTTSDALTMVCNMKNLPPATDLNSFSFKDMLESKQNCDVTIHVKDKVFEAHKNILAASSSVFFAMFEHEMSEKNSGIVSIPDCEPESFADFLRFLYSGRTDITSDNVYPLYRTAHKYCVEELITHCVAFMIQNLSADNICDVAALGDQYSDINLNVICEDFFEKNVSKILPTSQWKSLLKDHYLVAFRLLKDIAPRITLQN